MAEVAKMNCENCGRSGKITQILLHHIVPRESHGGNEQDNRLPLCSACERFIHFRYSNNVLTELKEKVLQEKDVQLFGRFVNSSEYIRRADVRDIENDFEKWRFKERWCRFAGMDRCWCRDCKGHPRNAEICDKFEARGEVNGA